MMCWVVFFGAAFSLTVMRKYRINYIYLIRMKSHSRINQNQIINFALVIFTLWIICLYFTYLALAFNIIKFYYFPFIIVVTSVAVIILPYKTLYWSYRYEILFSILKCFFPFGIFIFFIF